MFCAVVEKILTVCPVQRKLIPDTTGVPLAAARWPNIEPVKAAGNLPQALTLLLPVDHELRHFQRGPVGVMRRNRFRPRFFNAGVAERRASALRFGKGGFRACGNHLTLMLRDRREYMNREPGSLRHVAGDEIRTVLHQG